MKNSQVKTIVVPMIKGLRVKDILKFAREKTDIDRYLPDYKANKLPDRAFLWNIDKYIKVSNFI